MTTNLLIRKTHRYLGLIIGIQFLGWTISGLYFSWNDIDDVHGDHLRKNPRYLQADVQVVSPSAALDGLNATTKVDSVRSVTLINVGENPVYQIAYFSGHAGEGAHHHVHYALADANTGKIRSPLTEEEAVALAKENVVATATVTETRLLERVNNDHEFRERPLPAYAVSFRNPDCTVYISTELGTFQAIRHDQWRAFDFLWMFHTMDYEARDDINNWLLKTVSILGLVTVLSGFILFTISSRTTRKIFNRQMKIKLTVLIGSILLIAACKSQNDSEHAHGSGTTVPADTIKKSIPKEEHAKIGETHFTVKYHAPTVRGRTIWGGLVPYGEVWVTGAHAATSLEFDRDVTINGTPITAGKYALFTIPGKDKWVIIINKNWDQHLADEYDSKDDIVRMEVAPEQLPVTQERLKYSVVATGDADAVLNIRWEKLQLSLPIEL